MSDQPQASVHKSTAWSPPAATWGPHHHPWHIVAAGIPQTVVCAHRSARHPALRPSVGRTSWTSSGIPAWWTDARLSFSCAHVQSRETSPLKRQCALNLLFVMMVPLPALEACFGWRRQCRIKNGLGSFQFTSPPVGSECSVPMCYEKLPKSNIRNLAFFFFSLKECSSNSF